MFKNCCGCGRQQKVSDSSSDVDKEHDDVKDKSVNEVQENGEDKKRIDKQEADRGKQESGLHEAAANKQENRVQERKTEIVSSAAKNPGLVVDTTSTVQIVNDNEDDEDDNEVFPITPRTANMATPYPLKRNSTPGLASIPKWISQEEDEEPPAQEGGGTAEPPVTPVGRDELALRRHRFFSDLLVAAQAATEHRVRFDPLGPSVAGAPCDCGSSPVVEFNTILSRLENITSRLEKTVTTPDKQNTAIQVTFSPEHKPMTMSIMAYSDIIQGPLSSYLSLSSQIGGDVAVHAKLVSDAFQTQLQYLQLAASRAAPSQPEEMQLLQPTSLKIQAIQDFREKNRASSHFNHLSAISESIPALGWVTVNAAPAPYVKEMNDAGQFYTNRVLKDWKQKDQKHVNWVKSWVETLAELQKFVKQHHTTGLVWSGTKSGGAPPPPPGCPPPPPPVMSLGELTLDDSSNDRSALFAEINQGENITKTLKKVTSDMQTHKNPGLRSGPAPFKAPSSGAPPTTAVKPPPTNKPPVFARDGKKWLVEHQHKNQSLVIDEAEMNNVVYMYGCTESTLTVKGKINSVFLDSCKKSAVVFDSLVSSIEFVNCQSVQMQVLGKVPTISIDKTDGCQVYLSKDSMEVEIISSKSSEMNILVPKPNGDFAEYPVPEQYKTTVKPTGLTTIAVESKG